MGKILQLAHQFSCVCVCISFKRYSDQRDLVNLVVNEMF